MKPTQREVYPSRCPPGVKRQHQTAKPREDHGKKVTNRKLGVDKDEVILNDEIQGGIL